jgi:hypothetical protein
VRACSLSGAGRSASAGLQDRLTLWPPEHDVLTSLREATIDSVLRPMCDPGAPWRVEVTGGMECPFSAVSVIEPWLHGRVSDCGRVDRRFVLLASPACAFAEVTFARDGHRVP